MLLPVQPRIQVNSHYASGSGEGLELRGDVTSSREGLA